MVASLARQKPQSFGKNAKIFTAVTPWRHESF